MARKLAEVTNSNASADDVAAQLDTLRKDVSDLTSLIADLGKAKGGEISDAAKAKVDELHASARERAAAASDQAAALQGQANDFIKNQPAAALGIAAGLGFLVGLMSSRK
ncbi:ElaB/YqjD/DUF883 family membrane-anchored ribosome-binding protein [Litoreibacter ponti]|uniref:ElaB/YqjD/DUF883 family membrane-anchored ribosome-binding protein n=1 Tax=Litoreibacter ponti TaxID=1510457 RepID=A0A2T6BLW1_9RHOB|nr:DUF883 family protein [Litoreibacter ponti]PTX57070.1 ElaB/YqjD/DUF883 family membrane-anchored ribosome-binding protein [Litoreibacter ponti]